MTSSHLRVVRAGSKALDTVVAEDRRLEREAERTTGALGAHRWHWTKDESNPKRMSIRAYAKLVKRDVRDIQRSLPPVGMAPSPSANGGGTRRAAAKAAKPKAPEPAEEPRENHLKPLAHELIDAGYKALVVKYHPDKPGGSTDAMAQLNEIRSILKRAFE